MKPHESSTTPVLPGFIYLLFFESDDQESNGKILESIAKKYTTQTVENFDNCIKIKLADSLCTIDFIIENSISIFSISIERLPKKLATNGWQKSLEYYQHQLDPILNMLPDNPAMLFSVYIIPADNQVEALNLTRQYSAYLGYPRLALGVVRNCLVATFRTPSSEDGLLLLKRSLLLSPIDSDSAEGEMVVLGLLDDIRHMAINLVNLNRLYQLCQPYFPQLDPSGTEIQEKIEVILNRMRQTEMVDLETLKSWLSEVMDRFSTLSIMAGLLKRDQIAARTYAEQNINLLTRWGEIELTGYPTNKLMETIDYNSTLQPFEDFVERTQALRTQLETVSNRVSTYLGIQQQEQSSEMLKKQVRMLHTIEGHEKILKGLTYWVVFLTIVLISIEVLSILGVLH